MATANQVHPEPIVSAKDKARLTELLSEADEILSKYPYSANHESNYATVCSRVKSAAVDALKWCKMLHTEEDTPRFHPGY